MAEKKKPFAPERITVDETLKQVYMSLKQLSFTSFDGNSVLKPPVNYVLSLILFPRITFNEAMTVRN